MLPANMTNSWVEGVTTTSVQHTHLAMGETLEGGPLLDLLATFYNPAEKEQWSPIFTGLPGMPSVLVR